MPLITDYSIFRQVLLATLYQLIKEQGPVSLSNMEISTAFIQDRLNLTKITGLNPAEKEIWNIVSGKNAINVEDLLRYSYRGYSFYAREGLSDEDLRAKKNVLISLFLLSEALGKKNGRRYQSDIVPDLALNDYLDRISCSSSLVGDLTKEDLVIWQKDPLLQENFLVWNPEKVADVERIKRDGVRLSEPLGAHLAVQVVRKMFLEALSMPMPLNWDLVRKMVAVS